ncbi:hypothetical protein C0995_001020 [Termitomyces sp. Mi166|nr:hypothetical protein C0995_001020 [Termitomyces sp. Mi166\
MAPRMFRSYEVKANQGYNCTVVEAARVTTANPEFFKPVSIKSEGLTEEFIGASLGYNNPTSFVLEEAKLVFGASQPLACNVSIGAGHPGHISWKPTGFFTQSLLKVLSNISISCEAPVEDFVKRCQNLSGTFYRLNVDQGLQKMALDDWNRLGEIRTHSMNYLQKAEITQKVDSLVETLHNRPQKITLGALTVPVSPSATKPAISAQDLLLPIVPAPSSLFTGRADVLSQLEKYFVDGPS